MINLKNFTNGTIYSCLLNCFLFIITLISKYAHTIIKQQNKNTKTHTNQEKMYVIIRNFIYGECQLLSFQQQLF